MCGAMASILIATAESAAQVGSLKAGFAGRLFESKKLHIDIEHLGTPPSTYRGVGVL